jgi:NAD(P)-dependent dehydrogenase (short-subunit alcohol dehydrogenase family)
MPLSLTDEVAVVTGAASGNGRAIARALADHGADVVVADRRSDPREGGTPTHELIAAETDADARYVECDVTDWAAVQEAVATADALGGLSVMVNNAGIIRTGPVTDLGEADVDAVMDVNVKGTFFGTKAAAQSLLERGADGSIVNISSMAGLVGGAGNSLYCASKAAIKLFTYATAAELGPAGVRVNAVHPGPIETAMIEEDAPIVGTEREQPYKDSIPLQRFGQPEDVADAVLYLASDLSEFMTGSSLVLDGGISNTGGVGDIDPD